MSKREWVEDAACNGQPDIMFEPVAVNVALDLCNICEVQTECAAMLYTWTLTMDQIPMCVVAGTNRYVTKYGRPRQTGTRIIRPCTTCGRAMYLEPGSTKQHCSVGCNPEQVPADDIKALSMTLDRTLETT